METSHFELDHKLVNTASRPRNSPQPGLHLCWKHYMHMKIDMVYDVPGSEREADLVAKC